MLRYSRIRWNITLPDAILEVIELYLCIVTKAHYSKGIQLWLPETLPILQCLVIKAIYISQKQTSKQQEEQKHIKDSRGLFHLNTYMPHYEYHPLYLNFQKLQILPWSSWALQKPDEYWNSFQLVLILQIIPDYWYLIQSISQAAWTICSTPLVPYFVYSTVIKEDICCLLSVAQNDNDYHD